MLASRSLTAAPRFHIRMATTRRNWPLTELRRLEELHQALSVRVYGRPRPKHHHRMHISEQAARLGVMVDTEAGEAKHQAYKSTLANRLQTLRQRTQLQASLLGRMLQEQMDSMASQQPFQAGLLRNQQAARPRAARTHEMFTVAEGDILLQLPLTRAAFAAQVTGLSDAGGVVTFAVDLLLQASWRQLNSDM